MQVSNERFELNTLSIPPNSRVGLSYDITKDEYNVAGLPMQFNISVSASASPFYYKFDLFENVTNSSVYLEDTKKASHSFVFPATTRPGVYRLYVMVFFVFDGFKLLKISGPDYVDFEVKGM